MSGPPFGTEEIVAMAAADPDLRILRRAMPPQPVGVPRGTLILSCCAVEGTRRSQDRLRSLALRPFRADVTGRIVGIGSSRRWTTSRMSADRGDGGWEPVCDAEAASILVDAEVVVTHGARAIRSSVERAFPGAAGQPWICTRDDVDWDAMGLETGSLSQVMRQTGIFLGSDEPEARLDGLLSLLAHRSSPEGATLLGGLLSTACRSTWFVEVEDLASAGERMVADAGYSVVPGTRRWWREIGADRVEREVDWLTWQVCGGAGRPRIREIGWRTRHTLH